MDKKPPKEKPSTFSILRRDRNLLLACLAGFAYTIGAGAVWFVLPTIATSFTTDIMLLVLLLSVPFFFSVLMSIPFGDLSDYIGRKPMCILGVATLIPSGIMLLYSSDLAVFIVLSVTFGISNALLNPTSRAYVMDLAPKESASEYFGFLFSFVYLGASVGPLLAGFLVTDLISFNLNWIALMVSISGIVSLFLFIAISETILRKKSLKKGLNQIVIRDKLFLRAFRDFGKLKDIGILIVLVTFVISLVDGIIWTFEPLYYEELALDPAIGGILMFLLIMPMVLFQIPAGYLADKHGKFRVLLVGLAIAGTSFVLFGLLKSEMGLMITAFMTALGVAFTWPALSGIVSDHCEKSCRGDVSGVWSTFMDIPNIIAPFMGGVIVALYSDYGAIFWVLGVVILISIIPVIHISKRNSI